MPKNMKSNSNFLMNIPMPSSLNYNWNMGSLLGMILLIQIISGLLISLHYYSSINEAFFSVINISRNISNGWLLRFIHINGASFFFILIYIHITKNFMNNSFKMKITWNIGTLIILILMATAFMGYVLPWGQMSFWAATVITNLLSAIPIWGNSITTWLWGGFSVNAPTLSRFFSFHFILPFMIMMLSMIHILSLHKTGSSNPIMIQMDKDKLNFYPFFISKDIMGLMICMMMMFMFIFINPLISTDPENFIPANPLITPTHIQPEWYFLFAYAILRSIPNKLGGVIALLMSIMILMMKSVMNSKKSNTKFNKLNFLKMCILIHTFLMLTWIGMKQVENPFLEMGIFYTMIYFIMIIFF